MSSTPDHQCPDLFHHTGRPCCLRELQRLAKRKVSQLLQNDRQFQPGHPPAA